jgi:putative two-component system response regulator
MNVLVVDDETISLRLAVRTLHDVGYDMTTARDGREALEILVRGQHQLVVSDWNMPRMSGVELCRAVRSGEFIRCIYFILLTGQTRPEEMIEGLGAGADDYINKRFNPAELIQRVHIGRRIVGLETRDMTIFALAKLAESRAPETGAHLQRVWSYCRVTTRHLQNHPRFRGQVDDVYVRLIHQTSPLHDIGKVAISDHVLLKPGRLVVDDEVVARRMLAFALGQRGFQCDHAVDGAQAIDLLKNANVRSGGNRLGHAQHPRPYPGRRAAGGRSPADDYGPLLD